MSWAIRPLHLGPRQFHFYGASGAGEQQLCAVPAAIFAGQPGSGIFLSCMICPYSGPPHVCWQRPHSKRGWHRRCHPAKAGAAARGDADSLVNDFSVQALRNSAYRNRAGAAPCCRTTKQRGGWPICLQSRHFHNRCDHRRCGIGVLGNGLQNDGLIFLMQLPESGLCRLRLMVGSFWLRLFLAKEKAEGVFTLSASSIC